MPCLNLPPMHGCNGPDGSAVLMCAGCRHRKSIGQKKDNIAARRNSVSRLGTGGATGVQIQTAWNSRMDTIVADLFQEALAAAHLALPSASSGSWAFCISGSGARQEACPYSDLDCFLLLGHASSSSLGLFREAARKMRQLLVDMGEDGDIDTLGLRFCSGGLHPLGLGVASAPELMGEPAQLASLIETKGINAHICQGLSESRCLCGSDGLHLEYRKEVEAIRGKSLSAPLSRPMLPSKKKIGLEMIEKASRQRFMPTETSVDIKTDVYRIPQVMLAGLASYYGVVEQNSFTIVTALVQRGKITQRCANSFNEVLNVVAEFRTMAHLEQHREADTLSKANERNATQLSDPQWKRLMECKGDLYLMQQLGLKFVENKKSMLKSNRTNPFAIA